MMQPQPPPPQKWIFNGREYSSRAELEAAMAGGGDRTPGGARTPVGARTPPVHAAVGVPASPRSAPAANAGFVRQGSGSGSRQSTGGRSSDPWIALLDDEDALERKVKDLFRQFAGRDRRLSLQEMRQLENALGSSLRVSTRIFGDMDMGFHRFDFSGCGQLDEHEGCELIKYMLRQYRDSKTPAGVMEARGASASHVPWKRLTNHFILGKLLGKGGFGAVHLATDIATKQEKVLKFFEKSNRNCPLDSIAEEFGVMLKLDHPRIARPFEIFQDSKRMYIVSEPLNGGDLSTIIDSAKKHGLQITYGWLANIFRQVSEGTNYLHGNYMMHCDLKEPNAMVSQKGSVHDPWIVLVDFGQAQSFSDGAQPGGTPGYMPPEVWQSGLWTPKGDVFCLGVMFYRMWTQQKRAPFNGVTIDQYRACTLACRPDFSVFNRSPVFLALVQQMLGKDFRRRPTVNEVLKHDFFVKSLGVNRTKALDAEVLAAMSKQKVRTELWQALMKDMAQKKNLAQLRELNSLFACLDTDHNGLLSEEEMREGLRGQLDPGVIDNLVKALCGEDGKAVVSYSDFMGRMLQGQEKAYGDTLWNVFQELDTDRTGRLTLSNLQLLLRKPAVMALGLPQSNAEELMREMDKTGDGMVTFEEFKHFVCGTKPESSKYKVGDAVEYWSASYDKYMRTEITALDDATGAVQITIKPNYWIRIPEQGQKLRPVVEG